MQLTTTHAVLRVYEAERNRPPSLFDAVPDLRLFDPPEIDAMKCALFDGTRTSAQLRALVAERRRGSRKPVNVASLGCTSRTTLERASDEDLRRALAGLADHPEGT